MPTSDQLSQLAAECDPGHNVRRMSSFLPGTSTLGLRGQTWANSSLNRRATEHNPVNLVFCKEKLWTFSVILRNRKRAKPDGPRCLASLHYTRAISRELGRCRFRCCSRIA